MSSLVVSLRAVLTCLVLVAALTMAACGSSEADGEVEDPAPRDAVALIRAGNHVVIDLRSPKAYEAGHVAGAVNVPFQPEDFSARLDDLDLDRADAYLVYSRTGEAATAAAEAMVDEGFERVVDAGSFGILAIAGAPVE